MKMQFEKVVARLFLKKFYKWPVIVLTCPGTVRAVYTSVLFGLPLSLFRQVGRN